MRPLSQDVDRTKNRFPQGLKPGSLKDFTARLKPCPFKSVIEVGSLG